MLAGAYPSDEFAELKPRITWDRLTGVIEGRRDARVVAVTSGGTIPDRGLFAVFLVGEAGTPGRRVGELDEEMVYETRVGDVITLGATSWRVDEIGPDRVLVTPAPGVPGKLPFWHGDTVGRPIEMGRALGTFVRELEADLAKRRPRAAGGPAPARREPRPRRSRRREPASHTSRTSARRRAPCRPTGGSWWSGSATSSATGASASSRRSGHACTRRGPWHSRVDSASDSAPRSRPSGPTTGSPSGCRRATWTASNRPALPRRRRDRGPRRGLGRQLGAVRVALPRERRAGAAPAASSAGCANAALAAAAAGGRSARGGVALRLVPDPRGDVPRVPVRRVRPAGAARGPGERGTPRHRDSLGRDAARVAVRIVAALRLRRGVHVRGRRADCGTPCAGSHAGPRPAA